MTENRLAQETSPYLLQHKNNPVAWYAWGAEAFEAARHDNKPILLSVGYAACHWCHVMAHESFEDDAIAALMNRHFVNIKVDREERPDLDSIYQSALALLGEHGGWPLTMFLTPDGEPFWGGTYFPPAPRYGRAGFPQVLEGIAGIFANEQEIVSLFQVGDFDAALSRVRQLCPLTALTRSEKGSVIVAGDQVHTIGVTPVERVVDATGAGDLYAAGLLFGITHGYDLPTSGRIGSVAATEIISHLGARPEADLRALAGHLL